MARAIRIECPNAWYHVTSRGNQRLHIFKDDKDRKRFIKALAESVELFRVEVHCYILMSNHFHFLLRTPEANLSRFMQRFNTAYIGYYNRRHRRSGHLYQGRYKAILIEADEYLLELSRYIHLNPVRVKIYKDKPIAEKAKILERYRWSSLPGYTRLNRRDELMHYDRVLWYKGGDNRKGRERYKEFVLSGLLESRENPLNKVKANTILGTNSFIEWVLDNVLAGRELAESDYGRVGEIKKTVPIGEIAKAVAEEYGVDVKEIVKRRSRHKEARQVLLGICHRFNFKKRSLREMGKELGGISGERITQASNLIHGRIQRESKLKKRIDRIVSRLQT
jgi:putative transposase